MAEQRIAIHVQDLVVGFAERIVIDHLSLDVREGEILGLVGASGGGKSVLLRTLIGLLPKRSGQIEFPASSGGEAERRGVLFQQGALFSALNARQNVQFPLREAASLSPALLDEIANAKLEMVGLTAEDGDKFPAEKRPQFVARIRMQPDHADDITAGRIERHEGHRT